MGSHSEYISRRKYLATISGAAGVVIPAFLYGEEGDEEGKDSSQYGMDCNYYSVTCAGEPEKFHELEEPSNSSTKLNQSVLEQNNSEKELEIR